MKSYEALLGLQRSSVQTVNRSLIAAFDLRRLKHRSNPYTRITKQSESTMSLSNHRLNHFFFGELFMNNLTKLTNTLRDIGGEIRVVMKHTGVLEACCPDAETIKHTLLKLRIMR